MSRCQYTAFGTRNIYAFLNKGRGRDGRKPVRLEGSDSKQQDKAERVRANFALTLFIRPHSPLQCRRTGRFRKAVRAVRAGLQTFFSFLLAPIALNAPTDVISHILSMFSYLFYIIVSV